MSYYYLESMFNREQYGNAYFISKNAKKTKSTKKRKNKRGRK